MPDTSGEESHASHAPQKVSFDSNNILVDHTATPDRIDLVLSVPLADGTVIEVKMAFASPTRVPGKDHKPEYKMDMSSALFVTFMDKESNGPVTVRTQDELKWEMPVDYPGVGTALLLHEPKVRDFLTSRFKSGGVFVDAGANVGAYSIRAAAEGMKVHAFEPD